MYLRNHEKGAKRYLIFRAFDNLHVGFVWAKSELDADFHAWLFFRQLYDVVTLKERKAETRRHQERVRRL